MAAPKAVVLVSGGMDSAVTAAIASSEFRLAFLHATYGQRTGERELKAFSAIADHYQAMPRIVISLDYFSDIGGSSLTDETIPVPAGALDRKGIPSTYVPFRNGALLSAAAGWAEVLGAKAIFVGAVQEDSSGYPDCRKEFYDAFEAAVREGTRTGSEMSIRTPVISLSKGEIVRQGMELNVPFHLTWSCYERQDAACGRCDSCLLRLKGFEEAGGSDPIQYLEHVTENSAAGEPTQK